MFTISQATEDDIPELAAVHIQGWRDSYGGIIDQGYLDGLDVDDRIKKWHGWWDPENIPVLMARDEDGKAAGFVNFGKLKTPPPGSSPIRPLYSGEIYAIYILADYWRKGLGTQLMKEAVKGLAERKHKSMCLWVLEKNKRACEFYKAMGGERCGKIDIEIGPTKAREVCYGWRDIRVLTD